MLLLTGSMRSKERNPPVRLARATSSARRHENPRRVSTDGCSSIAGHIEPQVCSWVELSEVRKSLADWGGSAGLLPVAGEGLSHTLGELPKGEWLLKEPAVVDALAHRDAIGVTRHEEHAHGRPLA